MDEGVSSSSTVSTRIALGLEEEDGLVSEWEFERDGLGLSCWPVVVTSSGTTVEEVEGACGWPIGACESGSDGEFGRSGFVSWSSSSPSSTSDKY